ncbi:MAG TPA: ATP-binding protein [Caldisericia bacterium]|nr:ATP-binding protein [Caldisericia bacterium]HOW03168.1 ATP-binding protein [Caldisericia bacterium]HPO29183.1 ATP-binding protein [Caldisericia bacterium]HXK70471.1 ATP-binding protein [Caldisericia bacterium]
MKRLFYSTRFQVIIFMIVITILGNSVLGYLLSREASQKLIEGKQDELYTQAKLLSKIYLTLVKPRMEMLAEEQYRSQKGENKRSYEEILKDIRYYYLETPLRDYTKALNESFEELGAGFYFADLGKVIAFESNKKYLKDKKLVAFVPLSQDGSSFVWIEESFHNIDLKIADIQRKAFTPLIIVILSTLLFGIIFAMNFTTNIRKIKIGLENLTKDLNYKLPNLFGEFGEISHGINVLSEKLLKSRSMSDLILASTKTGMVSFKENFELSFINDSALKILGLEKNESDGERIINLLGSIVKEGINQAFKKDNTFTFDSLNVIVNGKERYLNVTILPYYDPVGEKTVLITIDDVTENVKLIKEAQRDESLKMLGLFTTGVAHEIRNPLTSIKGFIQLLNKRISDESENKRLINLSMKEIERLESLIKDLIIYAKPSKPNVEWINVVGICEDVIQILSQRISQKKINLNINLPNGLYVKGDRKQLFQVFFNLTLNAIQAVKPEIGVINIYADIDKERDSIRIVIEDNGIGIPSEDLNKIFTPFFTTKDKGVGLGLAISRRIMNDNDGKLTFESKYGEGTKFVLELPEYKIEEVKIYG